MKTFDEYLHMRKWMVEFLNKFDSYGIEIAGANSIHITKSTNLP